MLKAAMRRQSKRFTTLIKNKIEVSNWSPYTKLIIKSDDQDWVLTSVANEISRVSSCIGINVVSDDYLKACRNQSIFYTNRYLVLNKFKRPKNRIALTYYHGNPENSDEFKRHYEQLKSNHSYIDRVQVSNTTMEELVLNTGIREEKVFRIPISIDLQLFQRTNSDRRLSARAKLGIPTDANVIGSFQKDGVGFGNGDKPKLIKGPDIFLAIVDQLRLQVPNLFVLLTGPARGYVKTGLDAMNIAYRHDNLLDYQNIGSYYQALDLYLITSREEGGPRAVLESMASGIPLVTSRVGQAIDLVQHGSNGFLVPVGNVKEAVHWAEKILLDRLALSGLLDDAYKTAVDNCYEAQVPMWTQFMDGFVYIGD